MKELSATRGTGLLEPWLARMRARRANMLIADGVRGGKILDIGCGSFPLFLHGTRFEERYGMDRLVTDATRERMQREGITLTNQDLHVEPSLPFADDTFDVVTMLAVIEHLPVSALITLLRDVHRVLRLDGVFILTTPANGTEWLIAILTFAGLVSAQEVDEHQELFSQKRIRQTLAEAGFDAMKIETGSFECGVNLWARVRKQAGAGSAR